MPSLETKFDMFRNMFLDKKIFKQAQTSQKNAITSSCSYLFLSMKIQNQIFDISQKYHLINKRVQFTY